MDGYKTVSNDVVRKNVTDIFRMAGLDDDSAAVVADTLAEAECEGRESHGLVRVRPIYEKIMSRQANLTPSIQFEEIGSSLYRIDGDNALGAVLANKITDFCVEKARENGACIAFVNNANHLGAAGYYTSKMARRGVLGILATNAGPAVAPWGGMSRILGTNPFSCSFPAGKYQDFTLDIATSASAMGKIIVSARDGRTIPTGWAMNESGEDTTSAEAAMEAFKAGIGILPMAGYKGTGIAMIIDVLAGILSGAVLSKDVKPMFSSGTSGVGYFCLALDIGHFIDPEEFGSRVEEWFDLIKSDRKRPGFEEILIPGEIENRKKANKTDQIEVLASTWSEIETIKGELEKSARAGS